MSQLTRSVVWFNHAKGYGFLEQDERPELSTHPPATRRGGLDPLEETEELSSDLVPGKAGGPKSEAS